MDAVVAIYVVYLEVMATAELLTGATSRVIVNTMTTSKTVSERSYEYLNDSDEWKRPREISEAVDADIDYTRKVLRDLHEADKVEKKSEPGGIIAHEIDGETNVIETRAHAKKTIDRHGMLTESEMDSMTLDELRTYIQRNLADRSFPLGKKVWYRGL